MCLTGLYFEWRVYDKGLIRAGTSYYLSYIDYNFLKRILVKLKSTS